MLIVADDGVGVPAQQKMGEGLGSRLVERLSRQLKGRFKRTFEAGAGARCTVTFPIQEAVEQRRPAQQE